MNSKEELIMLSGEKLKILAKLVHQQEVNRIMSVPFKSETDRVQYLRDSQETYQTAVDLVDNATELNTKLNKNQPPSTTTTTTTTTNDDKNLAGELLGYVEMGVGTAIRTVWNLHLRGEYLKKLRAHAQSLVPEIEDIYARLGTLPSFGLEAEVQELIKKIAAYKDVQYQYMIKWKNPSSRNFSLALRKKGITFEKMVEKYRLKLVREKRAEFDKPFRLLDDEKKIEVYDEIAKSSGRGTLLRNGIAIVADGIAIGLLLLTVGLMVWDIYSSEHKVQTAMVEGTSLVASLLGGLAGEFVGAAIGTALVTSAVGTEVAATVATAVAGALGLEASVAVVSYAFVTLAAAVTGFGIGIALGSLTALLVGLMFHSGGHPDPATVKKILSTENISVYVAPMPNADLLARQLTHQGDTHASPESK